MMNTFTTSPGHIVIHLGMVPNGLQTEFMQQRLTSLQGMQEGNVVVMHMASHQHEARFHGRFWDAAEGLWEDGVLTRLLALKPTLVLMPEIVNVNLTPEQQASLLANVAKLVTAGVVVETSLSILKIARSNDLLQPKVNWPMHATISADYLRKHVGDYLLHDEQPQSLLNRYYRGEVQVPEPLRANPATLYNLGNLIRLREAMLRFVNSHFSDVARQTNPAQIAISPQFVFTLRRFWQQILMSLASNLSALVALHLLCVWLGYRFLGVGFLLLLAPVITALYVHPSVSVVNALVCLAAFLFLFPALPALPDPSMTAYAVSGLCFVSVIMIISAVAYRQHQKFQQNAEQALLLRSLLRLAYDLSYAETSEDVVQAAIQSLRRTLSLRAVVVHADGQLWRLPTPQAGLPETEIAHAREAMRNGTVMTPQTGEGWVWCPLNQRRTPLGAIGLEVGIHANGAMTYGSISLLRAFSDLIVTALRRMELREAHELATQEAEREALRAALLSAVSHDLKTPLVSIIGSLSTLKHLGMKLPETDRQELLNTASEEAERLHAVIHNVLELTRLESGTVNPTLLPLDFEPLLEQLVARCQRYYPALKVVCHSDQPMPWVVADALLLEEVLYNLLDNAAKYAGFRMPVEIGVKLDKATALVTLTVADHGPGIAEAEREQIFNKYYRSMQGDQRSAGSGLGLAIARAIIGACNGKIWVEPRPDGLPGSAFMITLPFSVTPTVTDQQEMQ
jgi:K+-sensing histidine kinase KdpD